MQLLVPGQFTRQKRISLFFSNFPPNFLFSFYIYFEFYFENSFNSERKCNWVKMKFAVSSHATWAPSAVIGRKKEMQSSIENKELHRGMLQLCSVSDRRGKNCLPIGFSRCLICIGPDRRSVCRADLFFSKYFSMREIKSFKFSRTMAAPFCLPFDVCWHYFVAQWWPFRFM